MTEDAMNHERAFYYALGMGKAGEPTDTVAFADSYVEWANSDPERIPTLTEFYSKVWKHRG